MLSRALPLALPVAFVAFATLPPVRGDARLLGTFAWVGAVLLAWAGLLCFRSIRARASGRRFGVELLVVKAHYVQALVQGAIYVYWARHWPDIVVEAPLILAQIVFFYAFDALLSWSRGRPWRLGYGPLPIILSTNLLLWFRWDWYYLQFAMLAAGALGKEFIRWNREGRRTHIFNPSVFGQVLASIGLIATGTTTLFTRGEELAASFERLPHVFLFLFVLGLIVQYHFSVTLVTLSAVGALCALNVAYTWLTGGYWFATLNVGATVFLGAHLLITDPSTSPRTNAGRVVFGAMYGIGYALLFRLFDDTGTPLFWDKLLPVPLINLAVPLLDRMVRGGLLGRLNAQWEGALSPRRLNHAHMGGWAALFAVMIGTGFVQAPHEGSSLYFWRRAYDEGLPRAGHNLRLIASVRAKHGDGEACNMLGKLYLEGELLELDQAAAAHWFARSCELGYPIGCENVAGQFLFENRADSPEGVQRAFDHLEEWSRTSTDGSPCFLLGYAYETGRGRPRDPRRALELYELGRGRGDESCREGAFRLARAPVSGVDASRAARTLEPTARSR